MAKNFRAIIFISLTVIGWGIPALAHGWNIRNFESDIVIERNGMVLITEHITADFGAEQKHGIFRDVPVIYTASSGKTYTTITDILVSQDGATATTDTSKNNDFLRIKIGDPNRYLQGIHEYIISYRVAGVLKNFGEYDELYWNATGNGWDAPIDYARTKITVPVKIIQAGCYQGTTGSGTKCAKIETTDTSTFMETNNLSAGEGMTVAVGFTHGAVPLISVNSPPSLTDIFLSPLSIATAAAILLLGVFLVTWLWWRVGRDRFLKRSITPGVDSYENEQPQETTLPFFLRPAIAAEYVAPNGLRPGELGVLMDERADTLDVSATIVDLASRGYLEITEVDKKWVFGSKDYTFTKSAKSSDGLLEYESLLLTHLFGDENTVRLSLLRNTFYTKLKEVQDALYREVVRKKLFPSNPSFVRGFYSLSGFALIVAGSVGFILASNFIQTLSYSWIFTVGAGILMGLIASGVLVMIVSPFMSRRSGYGYELYRRCLGYRDFVSRTEKYRAKFLEDQHLFMDVLPYAIVFGLTGKLARAFKDMGVNPPMPTWYHGSQPFNAFLFASHIDGFSKSLGTAIASTPSGSGSGGGGFSGGGFGGSGGGSW